MRVKEVIAQLGSTCEYGLPVLNAYGVKKANLVSKTTMCWICFICIKVIQKVDGLLT